MSLGAVLVEQTSLSEGDLQRARERQAEKGLPLAAALLDLGALGEAELLRALGDLYDLPVRESLSVDDVDLEIAGRVPISFAKSHHLIPLRMEGENHTQ